ncbi:asparagine synthase-related protein [Micromonospora sp. S-DT3-3-22]|uniref:asparagine synthase-related protein n=1 Tax=Micromonospora sp. S-DT3-3-22 TaxID=2755359 RepID=UPI00188E2331|nr:asparagine synthase-related protein [Micromonospora sp. S-DT3-3-22]
MPRPTPFDIATGTVLGAGPPMPRTVAPAAPDPLAALDRAVLPALRRPPCVVSFSGGLDSSLVLAVAVRAARREGLPEPFPVTWRFTGAPRADESPWQHRVVAALGVGAGWEVLRADDDLDLVGPVAGRFLHRYGVRHPVNLHLHLPLLELAGGGSLLTGLGGDQVLAGWRRPPPRSARAHLARARVLARELPRRRRPGRLFPWLPAETARQVDRAVRAEQRAEPRRLGPRIAWHARRRDLVITRSAFTAVAEDHGVTPVHPLLDHGFLAALTALAGKRHRTSRDGLLAEIVGDTLPAEITAPRRKAHFREVFLRTPTREFVRSWDGTGAVPELVDVTALRDTWSRWPIPGGTAALVQQLWLATTPAPGCPPQTVPPAGGRRSGADAEVGG